MVKKLKKDHLKFEKLKQKRKKTEEKIRRKNEKLKSMKSRISIKPKSRVT